MYYYIFESQSSKNNFTVLEDNIRDYISELGIAGEMNFTSDLKTVKNLIQDAIEKKYSTIIAVGAMKHIIEVASNLVGTNLVFGIIPLINSPSLNQILRIKNWQEAADALKSRRFVEFKLGVIDPGRQVFLTSCQILLGNRKTGSIQFSNCKIDFSADLIKVELTENGNLLRFLIAKNQKKSLFNLWSKPKKDLQQSLFSQKKGFIRPDTSCPVTIESTEITHTPVTVSLLNKKLKIILARSREI